ncbi:hypothetical protein [Burkholderia gladioli]|uniref:hypothetical protein n=1 Tax=Burkholderia gladioli TaxID=28095 RepID=UPI00163E3849|nr:hypothetical protein [Burkholderia gladioli]
MPAIHLCFADRLREVRSDVIDPVVGVDSTYGSLMVARADLSEETIATRDEELDVCQYGGECPTALFLSFPDSESVREIALDPGDR